MTAVVAVMKIFGNKIVNSRNSNSRKTSIKPNKWLNLKKKHPNRSKLHQKGFGKPISNATKGPIVDTRTIRVLLAVGHSSGGILIPAKMAPLAKS